MANSSITLNSGSGGSAVDTDTVTGDGDHMQVVKPAWGAAGTRNLADTATPFPVMTVAYTSGGCSVYKTIDLDESEEEIKATAGQLFGFYFCNMSGATRYLKLYNLSAANTTVGSSTIIATYPLPGNATDDVAGTIDFSCPVAFDTAISAAVTTGLADNDTGAPGANDVAVMFYYK